MAVFRKKTLRRSVADFFHIGRKFSCTFVPKTFTINKVILLSSGILVFSAAIYKFKVVLCVNYFITATLKTVKENKVRKPA